jgi:tetratricopeptide (TPR) repeat protein
VLCFLEQYATALSTIDQALGIADHYYRPFIANNRCSILVLNDAFSEALDALDTRLAHSSQYDHSDLLFTRATCLLHMERYDEAIAAYEQAIAEDWGLRNNDEGLNAARLHRQPDWDKL